MIFPFQYFLTLFLRMPIPLATLNLLMVNFVTNPTILANVITLGANDFNGGLTSASQSADTAAMNTLKGLVAPNDGLLIAAQTWNTNLIDYFKTSATNQGTVAIWCSQNGFSACFTALVSYVTNPNDLLLCYVNLQDATNVSVTLASNPTNLNAGLAAAVTVNNPAITVIMITAGANNFLECIEIVKTSRNNVDADSILSQLLAAL
jgi:hypothetical protein